jgi:hypothetical protein
MDNTIFYLLVFVVFIYMIVLTPSEYSRDTPELFVIKLTKLQLLTPAAQRLTMLQWYRGYLCDLHTYYQTRSSTA